MSQKGRLFIYSAGQNEPTIKECSSVPTLKEFQDIVGGTIQLVPGLHKFMAPGETVYKGCIAYCNEDGIMLRLPINVKASKIWQSLQPKAYPLLGTVVIVTGNKEFMVEL